MVSCKVVVETSYVGVDIEYPIEFCDDEVEGMSDDDITLNFGDEAWETIKNNLCFHIEREEE